MQIVVLCRLRIECTPRLLLADSRCRLLYRRLAGGLHIAGRLILLALIWLNLVWLRLIWLNLVRPPLERSPLEGLPLILLGLVWLPLEWLPLNRLSLVRLILIRLALIGLTLVWLSLVLPSLEGLPLIGLPLIWLTLVLPSLKGLPLIGLTLIHGGLIDRRAIKCRIVVLTGRGRGIRTVICPVDRPRAAYWVEISGSITRASVVVVDMRVIRRRSRVDTGTINVESAAGNTITTTRGAAFADSHGSQGRTGKTADLVGIGTSAITVVPIMIDDRNIVDHRGTVDDRYIIAFAHIVVIDLRTGDILMRHEAPIMRRGIVPAAISYAHGDTGLHRRPAIIVVAVAPADPGRRPVVPRDPHPAIAITEEPTAVVKGRPAPGIIGIPGPALIGIDPMAIGGIRFKIGRNIRHPDITIVGIFYPLPIGAQLIIKGLIRNIVGIGGRRRSGCCRRRSLLSDINGAASVQSHGHHGHEKQVFVHRSTIFYRYSNHKNRLFLAEMV